MTGLSRLGRRDVGKHGAPGRGRDLVGGFRKAAAAVAMTITQPSPQPETVSVCATCGCATGPGGALVDLSTALRGCRFVRFEHALCPGCFDPPRPTAVGPA